MTSPPRLPSVIAAGAAIGLFAAGIWWGTFAAGGSDSSCYLNQARLFRSGTTHIEQPLVSRAPWPRAEWTFTPAGHVPSAVGRDIIVPMCPPGLPLLMAVAGVVRGGEFLVVPCAGALAVWLTFVLGRRLDSPRTGAAAAVLLACSPSVMFQVVQPMTDVAAMAWWLLAAVLAIGWRDGESRPFAAGLAGAMAVLTRPNLLPLAVVIAAYVASGFSRTSRSAIADSPPKGGRQMRPFLTGLAPGLALLAVLQWKMYGSPIATGYGPAQDLFKIANVLPNLQRYPRWLVETHTPLIALALAAPLVMRRRAEAWLGLAIAATTLALYLPYQIFDDWYYVRFLLPALPWLIVLSLIVVDRAVSRVAGTRTAAAMAAIAVAVGTLWIATAQQRRAFELAQLEHHFVEAGAFAADRLPANAAVLTIRHSGSVHYYSQRPTISWDTLESGTLDRVLLFLREQGLTPILLLDTSEEATFRQRFEAASPIGRLDWPPLARVGRTIRVYDPANRARYFARASAQPFQ
jgi:Dolichyl-phosphate-mannose-protein mannosyltransferase